MKKAIFTLVAALFTVYALNAQDLTSKKGFPILPEKGDYSISIDAVPFFYYIGNMMNGTENNAAPTWDFPGLSYVPMWTIQGKKFLSATTAVRARVRLGYTIDTKKNTIADQANTGTEPAYVDDKWTLSHINIVLGGGLEKRRGKGRVQGVYGFMANLMFGKVGNKVVYGNDFSSTYATALSTDYPWTPSSSGGYEASTTSTRVTKDNSGMTYGIGANVFVGVEYFFAPKMSIGGEFSWGMLFSASGKSKFETEGWDGSAVKTMEYESGGTTYFGVDNANTAGAIMLNFYF